jgi:hypothetical protein
MSTKSYSFRLLVKEPSGYVPLVLSLLGLAVIAMAALFFGVRHHPAGGWAARVWWILMAAHMPAITFFVITWPREARRAAMRVLALQVGGVVANFLAVYLLGM